MAGSAGVALLYRALAVGTMSIVAPITAVCAVAVPVLIAFALGERPGVLPVAGIAMAIVAIALVSRGEAMEAVGTEPGDSSRVDLGRGCRAVLLLSGANRHGRRAVAADCRSPHVSADLRGADTGGTALAGHARGVARTAVGCGALDMLANALYLVATRYGPLSLVATLASLYPASTVLLARLTLGERLTPAQMAGVVCAILAVLLIVGNT